MNRKQLIKKHVFFLILLFGIWSVYILFDMPCPIKLLTGFPCPACGATRALLALLHGDIQGYLHYHPLALVLVSDVLVAIHIQHTGRFKTVLWLYLIVTLIINLVYNFYRIF